MIAAVAARSNVGEPDRSQWSTFLDVPRNLLCISGFDGRFKLINFEWQHALGFSQEELLAIPRLELVHPEDLALTIDAESRLRAGTGAVFFENRYRCKDGSYRWLLWDEMAFLEQQIIYAAARDITNCRLGEAHLLPSHVKVEQRVNERTAELAKVNSVLLAEIDYRRHVEKSLAETQEKYRCIFENAVEGIFQSTPEGVYLDVNPAMARIKGYDSPQELMAAVEDIGRQSYVDPNRRIEFKSLMEQHGVVMGFEYQAYREDGNKIWLSMNARAVRDAQGAVLYYEGTVDDITERKRLETQLRLAQKMEAVGQLAGGIAHDFNNLLGVIIGYSEMMEERLDPSHILYRNAGEIRKAAQRAASLTRQLLAFSRQQAFDPKVINLNSIVADTEHMLRRLVGENIEFTNLLDKELGEVKADQGQIEQVIVNLVVNARDAMPDGGRLTIETANVEIDENYACERGHVSPGSFVLLSVTDTGVGMNAETQSHIFEPFFTTKERGRGTGLGLATVYAAVKQNGGFLWVDSEPGKGSRFQILLRRVQPCEETNEEVVKARRSLMGDETILLVEDDASLRELTRSLLTQHGYTVLEAANGLQATKIAQQSHGKIHLLLTDVVMPYMSGPQVAEKLTLLFPDMRVLYMSGYTQFASRHHEVPNHGQLLLCKPFTKQDIAIKVREAIEGSPVQAESPLVED